MTHLFSKIQIRGVEFRNRVFVSPMCQYSAVDGVPQPWHLVHLGSRAVGGAGLVMVEATSVSPEGRISPGDSGIWNDDQAKAFAPIAAFIQQQGAIAGLQLAHAGRKASCSISWEGGRPLDGHKGGWTTLAPSPVPFAPGYSVPKEMDHSDIAAVIFQFAAAARRALAAGFRVIEIHMAHGYLLHEFLSPLANMRKDAYGGILENRMRFPLQVAKAVRSVWPEKLALFVRISASDWTEGGWDIEQSAVLAKELKNLGVDLIDCSSGALIPNAKIPAVPGYQVPFAQAIRSEAGILTGAVGLITEAEHAAQILEEGHADVIFLARELLRDPYWPLHAAHRLGVDLKWPNQYERAKPML